MNNQVLPHDYNFGGEQRFSPEKVLHCDSGGFWSAVTCAPDYCEIHEPKDAPIK